MHMHLPCTILKLGTDLKNVASAKMIERVEFCFGSIAQFLPIMIQGSPDRTSRMYFFKALRRLDIFFDYLGRLNVRIIKLFQHEISRKLITMVARAGVSRLIKTLG